MSNEVASTNRVGLRVVEETVWGTTPATPTLQALRFTSESLKLEQNYISSEEIRDDRMTADVINVSFMGSGSINGELSAATYDLFLRSVLEAGSAFVSTGTAIEAVDDVAVVKTAGTPNSWTLTGVTTTFDNKTLTAGQFVVVEGFAAPFYAQITTIAESVLGIAPLADVASQAAGPDITITPLPFIRNGVTPVSMTIQKSFGGLESPFFENYRGAIIGSFSLEVATNQISTVSFDLMAKDYVPATAQIAGATVAGAGTSPVISARKANAAVVLNGDPGNERRFFNSLSINLDTAQRGREAIGEDGLIGIATGRNNLTGEFEVYLEDETLAERYAADTYHSLSFMLVDALGNGYIVTLPRIKVTDQEQAAGGSDQDVFVSGSFEAIADATGTYQIQISKIA